MADKGKMRRNPGPSTLPFGHPMNVHALSRARATPFDIATDDDTSAKIAHFLGLSELRNLRFRGKLAPLAEEDWRAEGRLTAETVQPCVATLQPVRQKIDEAVTRDYVPEETLESLGEIDLDPDAEDEPDGYGSEIDVGHLMLEALALALNPYPRADNVAPVVAQCAPPGVEPLSDDVLKPFAKLAEIREKLTGDET